MMITDDERETLRLAWARFLVLAVFRPLTPVVRLIAKVIERRHAGA